MVQVDRSSRQIVAGKLQAHLQPVDSFQASGEAGAGTSATSSDELYVSVCLQTARETALLDVLDNVYTAADEKQVTVLIVIGFDLFAAFDTVCHQTLL